MTRLCRVPLLVIAAVIATCGCGSQNDKSPLPRGTQLPQEQNNFFKTADNDGEFNLASAKAHKTVGQFIKALDHPGPALTDFGVIKRCHSDAGKEDLWLGDITLVNGKIHGHVNNVPEIVTTLHYGDEQTVAPSDIIDWKYNDHGKLVGGYTIRALYDEASPAIKKEVLKGGHYTEADMVRNF